MSPPTRSRWRQDERSASEVLSLVLLLSLVMISAGLVVLFGASALDQAQTETDKESARLNLQDVDRKLSSLSSEADVTRTSFDFTDTGGAQLSIRQQGQLNVTVNDDPDCHVSLPMSAIEYEYPDGTTIAYQAGGVWERSAMNGTTMRTAPDVSIRNGTVDISVTNVTGSVEGGDLEAVLDAAASQNDSEWATEQLRTGDCIRPDSVKLSIESPFSGAWEDYLASQTDGRVESFANGTTRVRLSQADLPPKTDDARNQVLNFSQHLTETTPSNGNGAAFTVEKGGPAAGNSYVATVRPLNNSVYVGETIDASDSKIIERTPLDVMFVLDVSWSGENLGGLASVLEHASANAVRSGVLGPRDRVGIVAYKDKARVVRINGKRGLTTDHEAAAQTMESLNNILVNAFNEISNCLQITECAAGSESCVNCGITKANAYLHRHSNQSRNQADILMTPGKTSGSYYNPDELIRIANQSGDVQAPIHTVMFAGIFTPIAYISEPLLCATRNLVNPSTYTGLLFDDPLSDGKLLEACLFKKVAKYSGGRYYNVTESDTAAKEELQRHIEQVILESKQGFATGNVTTLTPVTTTVRINGGDPSAPSYVGDDDHIATVNDTFGTSESIEAPNLNSPTAPSYAQHTFSVGDGEETHLETWWYGCEKWEVANAQLNGSTAATCTDIDEDDRHAVADHDTRLYVDGDDAGPDASDASPGDLLYHEKDWHVNLSEALAPHLDEDNTFDLESNQAIVVYDLGPEDEDDGRNKLPMLVEIGQSENEVRPPVVNAQVKHIRIG